MDLLPVLTDDWFVNQQSILPLCLNIPVDMRSTTKLPVYQCLEHHQNFVRHSAADLTSALNVVYVPLLPPEKSHRLHSLLHFDE